MNELPPETPIEQPAEQGSVPASEPKPIEVESQTSEAVSPSVTSIETPVIEQTTQSSSQAPIAVDSQESHESLVDESKAWDMAHATKDFRGKAADNRAIELPSKEELRYQEITDKLQNSHPKSMSGIGRLRLGLERDRLREAYTGPATQRKFERDRDNEVAENQFIDDFPEEVDSPNVFSPTERARFYDEQATRIETWAAAIHDHPLSREFKKAHPGVQFQPKALVRMEDEVKILERDIRRSEERPPYSHTQQALSDALPRPTLRLWEEEDANEYDRIVGELFDRAEEFDEFYGRMLDKNRTQPMREHLAITRNVLNDVRREVGLPEEAVIDNEEDEQRNQTT